MIGALCTFTPTATATVPGRTETVRDLMSGGGADLREYAHETMSPGSEPKLNASVSTRRSSTSAELVRAVVPSELSGMNPGA